MGDKVIVYISSVAGNLEVKKKQQRIEMILTGKKINVEYVDVAASDESKQKMRDLSGNSKAIPPQIFNGDTYCGDFDAFDDAVESDTLKEFLKLE